MKGALPHPNPSPRGRGRVLLGFSLVVIVVLAFMLTRSEPPETAPELPTPSNPVVSVQPNPVVPASVPALAPPSTTEDAGVVVAPHDVLIHVTRNGQTAIGTRLELAAANGRRLSGNVDMMGNVTLPLEPGLWTVTAPRTQPNVLLVEPTTTELDVAVLAERVIKGRVVGVDGEPVIRAIVTAGSPHVMTEVDGTFTLPVATDDVVEVDARHGFLRSQPHFVRAPQEGLSLQLEPLYRVTFTTVGPGSTSSRIVVRHRFGMSTCATSCRLELPEGELTASAVAFDGAHLHAAKPVTEFLKKSGERVLKLEPVPPLTGRLLDANGNAVPGATLRLNRFNLSGSAYLDPRAMPKPMGFDNTVITGSDGSFSVNFPLENFPIWVMTADAPRELDRRVLVVPFDAPLEVRTK